MGADVLDLNQVHLARSHHKDDTFDCQKVQPGFGTPDAVKALPRQVQGRGLQPVPT